MSAIQRETPQRRAVIEILRGSAATLTAQELYERLRETNAHFGRATVFRTLDALVASGMAQRFERDGHVYSYASCSPEHHHHAVCRSCNRTFEIDERLVAPLTRSLERAHGFLVEHSALDFYGVCEHCRD